MTFLLDGSVETEAQDTLKRQPFADGIVRGLNSWQSQEGSLVVAIYGSWGSGKTSVKNLVCRKLEAEKRFYIAPFNPWHWGTGAQIARHLFKEIDKAIQEIDSLVETPAVAKARLKSWRKWTRATRVTGSGMAAPGELPLPGVAGWFKGFGYFISKIGEASHAIDEGAQEEWDEKYGEIEDLAKEVRNLMQSLRRPILVTVDDVDRLGAMEIQLLFQLIKANSDFPNLAFLVLCQRDIVEHSLAQLMPAALPDKTYIGGLFLDKIVHAGLTLPQLSVDQARQVIQEEMANGIAGTDLPAGFQLHSVEPMISPYLDTIRKIKRYVSGLAFQLSVFSTKDLRLVHEEDLALLEVLRLYEPAVFEALRQVKQLKEGSDRVEARNYILTLANPRMKSVVDPIIRRVFPILDVQSQPYKEAANAKQDCRVCNSEVADRYFSLVLPVIAKDATG